MFGCKPEEVILHGEISGIVTDTITTQPLQAVAVKLNPINDTTSTSSDGRFLFKSLIPGEYKIEVSKPPYAKGNRNVNVTSAITKNVYFALHKVPHPEFSERYVDFGFDSELKSFTIKNTGIKTLQYSLYKSQDWITVYPTSGEATTETDTFKVTINRTGLSYKKHIESIEVVSRIGIDLVRDTINVLVNGVMDQDKNYYGTVIIGTQVWLDKNLNTGLQLYSFLSSSSDNGIIEKYCYNDNKSYCDIYGGLYTYNEAMNYSPPNPIGPHQGICPVGWHIPDRNDRDILEEYLEFKTSKLKEAGTTHWHSPNTGATNETGFTALPGGLLYDCPFYETLCTNKKFLYEGQLLELWTTTEGLWDFGWDVDTFWHWSLGNSPNDAASIRCIKDPPENK
jgi:uncharacterized protein (TIGR02145 family)